MSSWQYIFQMCAATCWGLSKVWNVQLEFLGVKIAAGLGSDIEKYTTFILQMKHVYACRCRCVCETQRWNDIPHVLGKHAAVHTVIMKWKWKYEGRSDNMCLNINGDVQMKCLKNLIQRLPWSYHEYLGIFIVSLSILVEDYHYLCADNR